MTLTYFDRKAFFLSISRFAFTVFVILLAIWIGGKLSRKDKVISNSNLIINERARPEKFKEFSEKIQKEYYEFIEANLKLHQNYPDILDNAASEFNLIDGQLAEIVGQVYRLQREIGNPEIHEMN